MERSEARPKKVSNIKHDLPPIIFFLLQAGVAWGNKIQTNQHHHANQQE